MFDRVDKFMLGRSYGATVVQNGINKARSGGAR